MPAQQYRLLLHPNGPALWPDHKPEAEVRDLQATTPETVWEATYQGNPTPPGGTVFLREWWRQKNRYDAGKKYWMARCTERWISWDTGLKDEEDNAYSACVVGEIQPEYHLVIREVWRGRLKFPDLPEKIESLAKRYNQDGKLRGVIIEDKASGTSAYQTLSATSPDWLKSVLRAFMPTGDKVTRAQQAAVWCKNDCIWLPHPSDAARWLIDFEDELFNFPGSSYKDQVDAFSQLALYLEHYLSQGFQARQGK